MTDGFTKTDNETVSGEEVNDLLVGQASSALEITAPAAGETRTISLEKGQTVTLSFDATSATPVLEGNDFVLTFDSNGDGSADSRIVFQNLVENAQGADAPVLVIGGVELSSGLLIGQAQALAEGETLETAAGAGAGPQGGGGSVYNDNLGDLIDLLQAQEGLDGTGLESSLLADGGDILDPAEGILNISFETEIFGTEIDGQVFGGGFEDWDHRQDDCDDGHSPMQILVEFVPADNEDLVDLTISGIPEGALFFIGNPVDANGDFDPSAAEALVGGSITLTSAQLAEGIFLLPPENSDADIPLEFAATIFDKDSGNSATITAGATATIDAVVDKAVLNIDDSDEGPQSEVGDFVTIWGARYRGHLVAAEFDADDADNVLIDNRAPYMADPSIETLANGGFVAVWHDYSSGGGAAYQIKAQVFGVDGDPKGETFIVDNVDIFGDAYPDVAALSDGGFATVWVDRNSFHDVKHSSRDEELNDNQSTSLNDSLIVKIYQYNNAEEIKINIAQPDGYEAIGEPSITGLSGGGFVVAWTGETGGSYDDLNATDSDVYLQRFDASGNPVSDSGPVRIETPENADSKPDVTATADGGFILAWSKTDGDGNSVEIRRFSADSDGSSPAPVSINIDEPDVNYSNVEVTSLGNGGFAVVYGVSTDSDDVPRDPEDKRDRDPEAEKDHDIQVKVYDQNNDLVETVTIDLGVFAGSVGDPHVSSLDNGGFVVVWQAQGKEAGIVAQRFNVNGKPIDSDGNVLDEINPSLVSEGMSSGRANDPHVTEAPCDDIGATVTFAEDNATPVKDSGSDNSNDNEERKSDSIDNEVCYVDGEPIYPIGFNASIGEDRDGSEELTVINIGLVDQLLGEEDPRALGLEADGSSLERGDAQLWINQPVSEPDNDTPTDDIPTAKAVVADKTESVMLVDGAIIKIMGTWVDLDADGNVVVDGAGKPIVHSGFVNAQVLFGEDGTLSLNFDFDSEGEIVGNEGIRVWSVDLSADSETALSVRVSQHSDHDFDINYGVTTRDNAQDEELLTTNNETTAKGTLHVNIEAVADGAELSNGYISGPDELVDDEGLKSVEFNKDGNVVLTYSEDAESAISDHGAGATNETPLTVQVRVDADLTDDDGSEAVTRIVINKGVSDGVWVNTSVDPAVNIADAIAAESGNYIVKIDGFDAVATIDEDGNLVLSFSEEADAAHVGKDISITDEIGIQLPIDDSTDFQISIDVTTSEVNPEGEVRHEDCTHEIKIDVVVEGVVGTARIEHEAFDGDEYCGLSNLGFVADSLETIVEKRDIGYGNNAMPIDRERFFFNKSENAGELNLKVKVLDYDRNAKFRDDVKIELQEGETITVKVSGNGTPMAAIVDAYGNPVTGSVFNEADGTLTFTAESSGPVLLSLYNTGASPDTNDGGTYSVNSQISIAPGIPTYVFAEDGDPDTADQGAETGPLVIGANFNLHTEDGKGQDTNDPTPSNDDDNSEAITAVKLTLTGAPDGTEFVVATDTPDGSTVTIDGSVYTVAIVGSELTLTLSSGTGAQNIALGDVVSVKLPQHTDDDFRMDVVVETTEYDDDGGASQTTTATDAMKIVIDAVADTPSAINEEITPTVSLDEEATVTIPVEVSFADNDGSETHTIVLNDIPSDWIPDFNLPDGATYKVEEGITPGDSSLKTTYSITIDVTSLGADVDLDLSFNPQDWTSSRWDDGTAHDGGDASIGIVANAYETGTPDSGVEPKDANNHAESSTAYTVSIAEDIPTVKNTFIHLDETEGLQTNAEKRVENSKYEARVTEGQDKVSAALIAAGLKVGDVVSSGYRKDKNRIDMESDGTTDANPADQDGQESIQFFAYDGTQDSGLNTTAGEDIYLFTSSADSSVVFGVINPVIGEDGELTGGTVVLSATISSDLVNENNAIHMYVEQYESLEHPNENSHNESINLDLKYFVTDDEGDQSDTARLRIQFRDDGPTIDAENAKIVIDDDDVPGVDGNPGGVDDDAPANTTGTLSHNYGADEEGATTLLLDTGVAPAGFIYEVNSDGTVLTVKQGDVAVMSITLDDTTSGNYTVTQLNPIKHPEGSDENNVEFVFNYRVTDGDKDTVDGTLSVSVDDDTPVVTDEYAGLIKEKRLDDNNPNNSTVSDTLDIDFGADGGSVTGIEFKGWTDTEDNDPSGSILYSGKVAVVFASEVVGDELIYTGSANGQDVIKVVINQKTGEYSVTQLGPVDHPDISYDREHDAIPDGQSHSNDYDPITLRFEYTVTDGDGDIASADLNVVIEDDEVDSKSVFADRNVFIDEATLVDSIDNNSFITGKLVLGLGADGGSVTDIWFDSWEDSEDGRPDGQTLTSGGVPVVFGDAADDGVNIVLVGKVGEQEIVTVTINKTTGDYRIELQGAIDHPDTGGGQFDPVTLSFRYETIDGDGDQDISALEIIIEDDQSIAVADNNDADAVQEDSDLVAIGNVLDNDTIGADGAVVTTTSELVGIYGSVTIGADGQYTYNLNNAADNVQALAEGEVVYDTFSYEIEDGDGDTSTAELKIKITGTNDAPVAVDDIVLTNVAGPVDIPDWALTQNDTDIDGDALIVDDVSNPVHATVSHESSAKTVTFEQDVDFLGFDQAGADGKAIEIASGIDGHTYWRFGPFDGIVKFELNSDHDLNPDNLNIATDLDRGDWIRDLSQPADKVVHKIDVSGEIRDAADFDKRRNGSIRERQALDKDAYVVHLMAGEILSLASFTDASGMLTVKLFAENGTEISFDASSPFTSVNGGTYYIDVASSDDLDSEGNRSRDYDIELNIDSTALVDSSFDYTVSDNIDTDVATVSVDVQGGDTVEGAAGDVDEILIGGAGADTLIGNAGDDTLIGNGGDDILIGGAGSDILVGGSGKDIFDFAGHVVGTDVDVIKDYMSGEGDVLDVSDLVSFTDGADDIADFIQTSIGTDGHTHVSVSTDGGTSYKEIAILENVSLGDTIKVVLDDTEIDFTV
ncbi:DUF5801 repeats-in-toxin domain-containing protein [Kiloniella sp. EL199]|uniref:DUF5801 repeats-in-toxin domain-containing protein n=1 Tax=Kiloniella sp. EL199 TaxID=2107581 RepID=UPI000EA28A82|nr:DUF5801 repeats-in-toxin domain-containing protein [Kiloniella sp. EL199]